MRILGSHRSKVVLRSSSPESSRPVPLASGVRGLVLGIWLQWFLRRRFNRDDELEAEHPKWIMAASQTEELQSLAVGLATEHADDAEAVAAIRAAADGKPRETRIAAAWMRSHDSTWEDRDYLRAARLSKRPPTAAR